MLIDTLRRSGRPGGPSARLLAAGLSLAVGAAGVLTALADDRVAAPVEHPAPAVDLAYLTRSGPPKVSVGPTGVVIFTTYPDMAACEAAHPTECAAFTDGTVVGVSDPLAPAKALLGPLVGALHGPQALKTLTGSCVTLPEMGSSPYVDDVYDGTGQPIEVGGGDCAALATEAANGDIAVVAPGHDAAVPPVDASIQPAPGQVASSVLRGLSLTRFEGAPNMHRARALGAEFVDIEAAEGTRPNPHFQAAHASAVAAGLLHGAYAVGLPKRSSATAEAHYFLAHGGQWSADGSTLPPALEMYANPTGPVCYGLSPTEMVDWIRDFVDTVHSATGVFPMIRTSPSWWAECTARSTAFAAESPLWLIRYSTQPSTVGGWSSYTFWQHAGIGKLPGEQALFVGDRAGLEGLAHNG